jgi:hypothetical protein
MFNSSSVGPQNIIVGCSKSRARRLTFKLSSQHLIVILQGPTLLRHDTLVFVSLRKKNNPQLVLLLSKCKLSYSLVENMMKKNRSRFPIAVLLTTLICSH